jgi:predicted  nucleic acid-binding Zn-ribbon protein
MEAASVPWRPIGELFVARGVITQDQLEEALAEQAASGKRLGEILVDRQLMSSPELTHALMEQLGRQVAEDDGFGSGLWSEIQRRTARGEDSSVLALVEDDGPPSAGPALRDRFAARAAKARSTDLALDEPAVEHEDLSPEPRAELEAMSRRLEAHEATIDSLTSELEDARAAVDARKEMLGRATETRQELRHDVQAIRECLAQMRGQLTGISATIASLRAAKEEREAAAQSAGEQAWAELDSMSHDLGTRTARVAQLEHELQERLAAAEAGTGQVDAEIVALRDRVEAVESELREECENHAATREQLDETIAGLAKTTAKLHDTEAASAEIAVRAARLSEEQAAVAETRLAALDARLAEELAASAETRGVLALARAELAARGAAAGDLEQPTFADYLCFAPRKKGYRLVPASGAMPGVGDRHQLHGVEYVVTRVGRSPLPSDPRRCAYLQAS